MAKLSDATRLTRVALLHRLNRQIRRLQLRTLDLDMVGAALDSGLIGLDEGVGRLFDIDKLKCLSDTGAPA